ncbi:hypothetical protein COCOR_00400 [Corallococcus coralloides DSM 2259]|uniref:Lipoprotein n=1 Tax=Corallococcus coralloides (strain ATCC 25202 / DSM 2259 / NBRC 100086 / M2) TaxID=1144275 RepID=H8MZV2_CORCM|nr:hypothetical protein [Corallococcus coralloides]AFE03462.1 hypothetical protein COCOR_00400 [Corallococcus coralloides DSM 2259]
MLRSVSSLALALAILCACSGSDPCEGTHCGSKQNLREGDDHGDSLEAATPVGCMEPFHWVEANLDNPEDVDLFSFHVTAGRIYRFSCTGFSSGYDPSCSVELLGADGLTLPGSVGTGGISTYQSAVLATQDGPVYARVTRNRNSTSAFNPSYKYSLVDRGPDDFANTLTEATPVPIGATVSGYVEPAGDVDVIALNAVAGRAYRLTCRGEYASHNCGMRVRGPEGEVLFESNTFDYRPRSETFDLQVMQEGRHTVELFLFWGGISFDAIGDYTFSVADQEP